MSEEESMSQGTQTPELESTKGYEPRIEILLVGVNKEDADGRLKLFDDEMQRFSDYLVIHGNTDPLSRFESAIIRSYLKAKYEGAV